MFIHYGFPSQDFVNWVEITQITGKTPRYWCFRPRDCLLDFLPPHVKIIYGLMWVGGQKKYYSAFIMSLNVQFPLLSWVSISNFLGIQVPWILRCGKVGRVSLCMPFSGRTHTSHTNPAGTEMQTAAGGIFQTLRSTVASPSSMICLVSENFIHVYNAFRLFLPPTLF